MSDGRLRAGRAHVGSVNRGFDRKLYEGEKWACATDVAVPGEQAWYDDFQSASLQFSPLLYDDVPWASTTRALGRRL